MAFFLGNITKYFISIQIFEHSTVRIGEWPFKGTVWYSSHLVESQLIKKDQYKVTDFIVVFQEQYLKLEATLVRAQKEVLCKRSGIKWNTSQDWSWFLDVSDAYILFRVEVNAFQIKVKVVSRSAQSHSWLLPFKVLVD